MNYFTHRCCNYNLEISTSTLEQPKSNDADGSNYNYNTLKTSIVMYDT